jgi:small subunit ribosomal protein S9
MTEATAIEEKVIEEQPADDAELVNKPKGRFITAIGRRKHAVANIRLYKKGNGSLLVNDDRPSRYFTPTQVNAFRQPLKLTSHLKDIDLTVVVSGGGKQGQAEAIQHGIARALLEFEPALQPVLRAKGYLTRDARRNERKKPGLKKARRAPQWAKR